MCLHLPLRTRQLLLTATAANVCVPIVVPGEGAACRRGAQLIVLQDAQVPATEMWHGHSTSVTLGTHWVVAPPTTHRTGTTMVHSGRASCAWPYALPGLSRPHVTIPFHTSWISLQETAVQCSQRWLCMHSKMLLRGQVFEAAAVSHRCLPACTYV